MRFDEIINAVDLAKVHLEEARQSQTFPDMRIQLAHAEVAMARAVAGIKVQIKSSERMLPLGATLPAPRKRRVAR